MSFLSKQRTTDAATAATTVTGAPTQTVTGSALSLERVAPGTSVACRFTFAVTTSSLQFTPYLEVSNDGSNYYTYQTGSACTAGTGTVVTSNQILSEPRPPYKWIRGKVLSSGATAVSGDTVAIAWTYLTE